MSTRATRAPSGGRRLLVISYYFGPHGAVGGLRWAGITKYLTRMGWEVAVVTAEPRPIGKHAAGDAQVESCPRLWTASDGYRWLRRRTAPQSQAPFPTAESVAALPKPPSSWRPLGREVAALLTFPDESRGWTLRAALRTRSWIRRFRPHVVVSSGPPHAAHLVTFLATLGSAVPWWIDLRDPWAGPLPEIWRSHRRLGTRAFRILSSFLERLAFRATSGLITNTDELARALAARYPDIPVACVRNGIDLECLPPLARDPYPGLGIAYAGMLYTGRDLGPVVRALRVFLERHPDAARAGSKLRVAGEADPRHARALYDAVAAAGIERHVEVLGRLPREQALNVVSRSCLAIVLAQDQELQVPAKLYESIALGVPTLVLAPADSATALEADRVGALRRDSTDVEGIAHVLEELWRDGARERPACPEAITYEAIAPLVDRLLSQGRADDARRSHRLAATGSR